MKIDLRDLEEAPKEPEEEGDFYEGPLGTILGWALFFAAIFILGWIVLKAAGTI